MESVCRACVSPAVAFNKNEKQREGGRIEKREDQRVAGFSASEIRPLTL